MTLILNDMTNLKVAVISWESINSQRYCPNHQSTPYSAADKSSCSAPPDITTMKVANLLVLVIIHLAHSAPAAILERELKISGSIIDNKSEIGDTSGTSASSGRSRYYTSDPCTDNNCQTPVPTSKTVDHGDVENRDMCGYISCKMP